MSIEIPTWDQILGGDSSTTSEFGGNWGNLISQYHNGVDIGLTDPTKKPILGTLTRYKFEKLGIFDADQSHYIVFSADDIDTGPVRKIKLRRMNNPFEEDYAVLEGLAQSILNKTIDSDLNTITNIVNADIKAAAGIVYSKLNLTNSIVAGDITSDAVTTAKILDANVTLNKLASNSVNSSKIVDDSIVNADINSAAAISWSKLSKSGSILDDLGDVVITSAAQYDMLIRDGASQWINLVKGGNSTVLSVSSGGVVGYNTITNAMVNASAAITTSKLADSANFLLSTLDNSFGAHYYDITRMSAPSNPSSNIGRFYTKQIDTNNDGFFVKIKKNGSFQEVQIA